MTTTTYPIGGETGGPVRALAELLDVKQTADLLNCGTRTVHRLADAGKMPRPVRLGSLVRWSRSELVAWIDAGCPTSRDRKAVAR
ncbi:MAG: helix-turn-helix domain-containing protein [Phycisphaerales bacterium]|nr:helix-turn-helix domain-containing protein [Phycisphaerales bacterium]